MIETEEGAVVDEAQVVVGVDGPPAMADDDSGQVDALFLEDALLLQTPGFGGCRGVRGDGHAGGPVRLRHRSEDPFHAGRDAGAIRRTFQDAGPYTGLADSFADFADEDLEHRLGPSENGPWALKVKEHRDFVVRVHPGGHDDVDLRDLVRNGGNARDVTAQPDDGEIDQCVDPVGLEVAQLRHGPGLFCCFVPLVARLLYFGAQHEDVLVHQCASESTSVDRASHSVDLAHRLPLPALRLTDAGRS
jgi:hypothetical protein